VGRKTGWGVRLAAALLIGGVSGAALAQTEGPGGRTVYEAAYFRQFSPSNALEVVRRVPGFTLELGSQEVRGFGQAAGNVVINGSRPSSKSDTLETILARIPASRVARVEIGPGDLFGSEFSGKAQVLNLVLTSAGGLAGTLNATVRRDFTGQITPEGSVSALYRRGKSTFNVSAGYNNGHFPEEGPDLVTLPGGQEVERREKFNDTSDHEAYVSGSWELAAGENRGAHLNFRAAKGRFTLFQENDVFPAGGTVRDDRLSQDYKRRDFELGGDVTRPLFGGGLKLIGLATRRHRDLADSSLNRVQGQVIGGFSQTTDSQRDESVLRLVWSRANFHGWSVETGAEGALNSLDSDVNLFLLDSGGAGTRIDLPVDQAKVTEYRGEAFVNAGRSLSPTLRMDLGLTYEASRLTVRGDATAERTLRFIKPKAVFDWKPKSGWHVQLSLARTVAQLNFEDFISSAELTNDRVDAGNADLVPQRAWEGRLTVEKPILGDGLAKVELGYDHISLLQDRVPTPEGFDAPGNLGTGRLMFVRATLDAPLTRFGVKGGRFTLNGTLRDTSVEDPYTHEKRRFSGYTAWQLEAGFRQDLGKYAWGVNFYGGPRVSFYRLNEIDSSNVLEPYMTAFAEYRPSQKTTVTLGVDNFADVAGERDRTFFFPDRSNRIPGLFEHRHRNGHVSFFARWKQSFG
jgi:TonB-dependent receptor-like protein